MTNLATALVEMQQEECCECGILFFMPDSLYRRAKQNGETFYCPSGHPQHYARSEVQRLKSKLEEQAREATRQAERALAAEKKAAQMTAKLKRVERRVGNGVCPCCNRTFKQLARHMKAKHPGYEKSTK